MADADLINVRACRWRAPTTNVVMRYRIHGVALMP